MAKQKEPVRYYLTRRDIAAFYYDVRRGRYKGRKRERDAVETMIFAAQKAGVIYVGPDGPWQK
jgi:hypothetical protein